MNVMESWGLVALIFDPYLAPEHQPKGLHGRVYGHSKFEDGDLVTTTRLVGARVEGDSVVVTTKSGTEYTLGTVDPEYEALYPNAKTRVIESIKQSTD